MVQHKHNLEIELHSLGHTILLKINDIVIEEEHLNSQFLAEKTGLCQMHLTVHLRGNDSVFVLINWVIASIN